MSVGEQRIDVEDLIRNTEFANGYTRDSPTIRYFFEVLRRYTEEELRELLEFVTGSPQVPLGGFAALECRSGELCKLKIHRDPNGVDRLPVAHTCFNRIDLPAYGSAVVLQEKLRRGIELSRGSFGIA